MALRTPRLLIRPLAPCDLDDYAAIMADPDVTRYLSHDGAVHDRDLAAAYLDDCIAHHARHGYARYAVCAADQPSRLIGLCGYKHVPDYLDLGWRYARHCWGQGLATEAGRAVLEHGRRVLGLRDIHATALVDNHASLRVIEKLGFAFLRTDTLARGLRSRHYVLVAS